MNAKSRKIALVFPLLGGFILLAGLLALLAASPAAADATIRYVAPGGNCGGASPCYATIQAAVDDAASGDEIRVAQGTYTGVNAYAGLSQVVYLTKEVDIRGGYSADFSTRDPGIYTTTLDAQGQGRVLYVAGDINPTIESLYITDGNATGLGGGYWNYDSGGGVYVLTAAVTISGCQITNSRADGGYGGGLFLRDSPATLTGNVISGNTAAGSSYGGHGGGLFLDVSNNATLTNNTISGNTANRGGGLVMYESEVAMSNNIVRDNQSNWDGSGLYLNQSAATVSSNAIFGNTAVYGSGSGLYLYESPATVSSNTISGNTAGGDGGGMLLHDSDNATLSGNIISGNSADNGGGLCVELSDGATVSGNKISGNTAAHGNGGGLNLTRGNNVTIDNNVIADNQTSDNGAGVYVDSPDGPARFRHNTIARNHGGDGSGLYITGWSHRPGVAVITNTIVVSHRIGIALAGVSTATLEATLWGAGDWANLVDWWSGTGTIFTGTINLWDDPLFSDPSSGDYHIQAASPAVDVGVNAGVTTDIDGDSRPYGVGYDIGADEFSPHALISATIAGPEVGVVNRLVAFTTTVNLTATAPLTYVWQAAGQTDTVTHTGGVSDTASFAWAAAGTYPLTVTVWNGEGNNVTDTHTIVITTGAINHIVYLPLVMR